MKILASAVTTWSALVIIDKHCVVHATSSSSSSDVSSLSSSSSLSPPRFRHPLLPLTTKLLGGATEQPLAFEQDDEETTTLEISIPLSQSSTLSKSDAPLMKDINMLMDILSDLVEHENPRVHDLYKEFLEYGQQR
jgi:hypothetical protein